MRSMVQISLVALFAFAALAVAASADDLPDAATLQAQISAAESPAPANYRQTITGHGTLADTSTTTYTLGKDERSIRITGAFKAERGISAGGAWKRNVNGLTIADDPLPADPSKEHHTLTVSRSVSPPGLVLSSLTARGYGTKTYVDPADDRVVRRDTIDANGTSTTTYTSFAMFGNRTLPAQWTVTDAEARSTMTYARTAYVVGDVTPADVAVPDSRALVTFAPGVSRVMLPATFSGGKITIHATVGGQPTGFVLDSGADAITISPGLARRLGLKVANTTSAVIAKRVDISDAVVPDITIGSLVMHDITVQVLDTDFSPADGYSGLLGFDFFATLGISIDYVRQRVTAIDGAAYKPPAGRRRIPLRLGDQVAMTSVTIDGARADRMIIDTGGGGSTFLLFDSFARRHPEIFRTPEMTRRFFTGVGGHFPAEAWKMHNIDVGTLRLQEFTGYRVTDASSYQGADGIIGIDFLRHFDLDFDYLDGQLFIAPNGDGAFVSP